MMREVEERWIEAIETEEARDLVEEFLDLLLFGIEEAEDRKEADRLLNELKKLKEFQAVEELSKKIQK